ncbi:histidine phosphatase family protein [Thiocapsa imhoffii]|uniref:Histidine phosphatase family protein n=1 Tax=Thiocapsa imhoffii TaxID=382777 RepID=A0A9X1B7K5_9GAMM|nr:histidine phosphatase family protein [Thiocapsa imhoffii]MBK1643115.1 histidine phosphatase family protein [Thiocapsa imhoffii]
MQDQFVELLRHGEAAGGACFRGGQDDPLSPAGMEQMTRATAQNPGWNAVFSSPARRCHAFAQQLAAAHDLPIMTLPQLSERHFGAWEGLTANQIPAADLIRFWEDPIDYTPPGAEPFASFRQRVLGAWDAVRTAGAAYPLVVTHGGVIRVILAEVLSMPAAATILLEVPPACLSRVRVPPSPGRPSLIRHGCA